MSRDTGGYRWRFAKRFRRVLIITLVCFSVLALVMTATLYISSVNRANRRSMENRVRFYVEEYSQQLDELKEELLSLVMKPSVQRFCSTDEPLSEELFHVNDDLENVITGNSSILLLYVFSNFHVRHADYRNREVHETQYDYEKILEDLLMQEEKGGNLAGTYKMSNQYLPGQPAFFMVYPVYSVTFVNRRFGTILLGARLKEPSYEEDSLKTKSRLLDDDGQVILSDDPEEIGGQPEYAEKIVGTEGTFSHGSRIVFYRKLPDWDYTVCTDVQYTELYREGLIEALVFVGITLAILFVSVLASTAVTERILNPINLLLSRMRHVSEETLREPICTDVLDEDGRYLAEGYNSMIMQINTLRENEQERQREADSLRFHLLQSQIQPHFLYNMLESIRWKAVLNQDNETAEMIKSLAAFYRLSLSGGDDIVTLETELSQIREYISLQNIRYNHLVELITEVPERLLGVYLPKITLQPLVENSIYHGIRMKEGMHGNVRISAEATEDDVQISVADNGGGMTREEAKRLNDLIDNPHEQTGYGISNVSRRLKLFFGDRAGLHYICNEDGGATAMIRIPREVEKQVENMAVREQENREAGLG